MNDILEAGQNVVLTEVVKLGGAIEEHTRVHYPLSDVWANASCIMTGKNPDLKDHYETNLREARVRLEEHISLCRRLLAQVDVYFLSVETKGLEKHA